MKLKSLLIVGLVAIAASALVSSATQRAMSGRVAPSPAPAFALPAVTGETLSLQSALRGRKAVLINFWFAGCPPCREEFPHLEKLYQRFKPQGLEVVAVNTVDDSQTIQQFTRENKLSFPIVRDQNNMAALAYKVAATPTNILIDARGSIIWRSEGFDPKELQQVLEETLR